jgi:hypothetical protein
MNNNTIQIPSSMSGEYRVVSIDGNRLSIVHHGLNNQGRPYTHTIYERTFAKAEVAQREFAEISTREGLDRKLRIICHNALVKSSGVGVAL